MLKSNGRRTDGPTAIDLFCGAGGFSVGLSRASFNVLLGVDSWPLALSSYAQNFEHPLLCADLSQVTGPQILRHAGTKVGEVDLLVGGPPCQGFSVQRIGSDIDIRNNLVLEYGRLIREIFPRLFVMENVPGLAGMRGHALLAEFISTVESAGFSTSSHLINAADYGVPQIRRRVIVLGWRKGSAKFQFPDASFSADKYKTVMQAIGDLPPPSSVRAGSDALHKETKMSALNRERLRHVPPGGGMQDLPIELRVNCHKAGAQKIGHRYVYGRLAPDKPAGTITARFDSFTRGKFAHPLSHRNITLREGARLQTFPDKFSFAGNQEEIAAQIGNAVPPMLGELIAVAARESLNTGSQSNSSQGSRQMGLLSEHAVV